ncbi:MAG: hypothetical protein ABSF91_14745 [Bacteroidota bacterium]|jgi:hypothetical protein
MAWQESQRLGKVEIPLLINFMKLRARELFKRCAFGAKVCGKSSQDVRYFKPTSMDAVGRDGFSLNDTLGSYSYDPLGMCVVNDFQDSLTEIEEKIADRLTAGYNATEIGKNLGLTRKMFLDAKARVQDKAVAYLR